MKVSGHPFLEISKTDFQNNAFFQAVNKGLNLPPKKFPKQFLIKNQNFLCGGYFVCYNRKLSVHDVVQICKGGNWSFLANLVADFFIIYCDFLGKKFYVLTDAYGKFPCFFSVVGENFLLSTDFAALKLRLPYLKANLSALFDYLAGDRLVISDQTIIDQIRRIPPATLLVVNSDLKWELKPLVDLDELFNQKEAQYTSIRDFAYDFLLLLSGLIEERLDTIGEIPFSADLSSGFDSPLLCYLLKKITKSSFPCYSAISQYTAQSENPQVIKEFAAKHKLNVKFIRLDNYYSFSTAHDKRWTVDYLADALAEQFYRFLLEKMRDGRVASFEGFGGDEVYSSFELETHARFPVQYEYFSAIDWVEECGLDKMLTKKGLFLFLDKRRFKEKRSYPVPIAVSAVTRHMEDFPFYWKTGMWPITPFADLRLVQLAQRIPHRGLKGPSREEIWKNWNEIFLPSQFRPKKPPLGFVRLFLDKKLKFVISVLEKSVLGEKGWVRSSEIVDALRRGDTEKYTSLRHGLLYLDSLLRLEYFLQHNNIKVPDYP